MNILEEFEDQRSSILEFVTERQQSPQTDVDPILHNFTSLEPVLDALGEVFADARFVKMCELVLVESENGSLNEAEKQELDKIMAGLQEKYALRFIYFAHTVVTEFELDGSKRKVTE